MKVGIIVRILWSPLTRKFAIDRGRSLKDAGMDVITIVLRKLPSG